MINLNSIKPHQTTQLFFKQADRLLPEAVSHDKVTNLNFSPKVYFIGAKEQPKEFLLPEEFREKNENRFMMGTLSPELKNYFPSKKVAVDTISEVASTLDILYPLLVEEIGLLEKKGKDIDIKFKLDNNKMLNAKYIAEGGIGNVFKLDIGKKSYALKIYNDKNNFCPRSMWAELALADYLNGKKFNDLAHFELASPKNDWAMFEYISDNMTPDKREGQSFKEFAKINNIIIGDHKGAKNNINGIIYDYGGIVKDSCIFYIRNLDEFKNAINSSDSKKQAAAAKGLWLLYEGGDMKKSFDILWDKGNPKLQALAVKHIWLLSKKDDRKDLFDKAFNSGHKDIQAFAAENINSLERNNLNEIKYVFDSAWNTGNEEVQEVVANYIFRLKEGDDRKNAYNKAIASSNPEVQAAAARNIKYLKKGDAIKAYQAAMKTDNPKAQIIAMSQLVSIPAGSEVSIINNKYKHLKSVDVNIPNLKVS